MSGLNWVEGWYWNDQCPYGSETTESYQEDDLLRRLDFQYGITQGGPSKKGPPGHTGLVEIASGQLCYTQQSSESPKRWEWRGLLHRPHMVKWQSGIQIQTCQSLARFREFYLWATITHSYYELIRSPKFPLQNSLGMNKSLLIGTCEDKSAMNKSLLTDTCE